MLITTNARISVVIPLQQAWLEQDENESGSDCGLANSGLKKSLVSLQQQQLQPEAVQFLVASSVDRPLPEAIQAEIEQIQQQFPRTQVILGQGLDAIRPKRTVCQAGRQMGRQAELEARADSQPLITWLTPGDQWLPHFLREISSLAEEFASCDIFATSYQYRTAEDRYLDPQRPPSGRARRRVVVGRQLLSAGRPRANAISASTFAIKRSLLEAIVPYIIADGSNSQIDIDRFIRCRRVAYSPWVMAIRRLVTEERQGPRAWQRQGGESWFQWRTALRPLGR